MLYLIDRDWCARVLVPTALRACPSTMPCATPRNFFPSYRRTVAFPASQMALPSIIDSHRCCVRTPSVQGALADVIVAGHGNAGARQDSTEGREKSMDHDLPPRRSLIKRLWRSGSLPQHVTSSLPLRDPIILLRHCRSTVLQPLHHPPLLAQHLKSRGQRTGF